MIVAERAAEPEIHASSSRRRRPSLNAASWLSLLPGLGQLYNRQPRKALAFFLGVAVLFFASFNVPAVTDALVAWWRPRGGLAVSLSLVLQMLSLLLFIGLFLGALAFWYASFHDARVTVRSRRGEPVNQGRWWFFHR
jgi:hypothetical protein